MAPNDVTDLKIKHLTDEVAGLRKEIEEMRAKYDGHLTTAFWGIIGAAGLVLWEPVKRILVELNK